MRDRFISKMNIFGVVMFCALVAMASAADQRYYDLEKAPEYFAQFMKDYNRTYKDEADKAVHYAAFVEGLKIINASNAGNPDALYGINQFADYTDEEFKRILGLKIPDELKKD